MHYQKPVRETEIGEHWYALRVRSRNEQRVRLMLAAKEYEHFLPTQRKLSQWSDRVKEVHLPLFPGYVFARFALTRRTEVLGIGGVVQIVGSGPVPQPVEEQEIRAIQTSIDSGLPVQPWPYVFEAGQSVTVRHGALTGLKGTLIDVRKQSRLVIGITLLHRCVAVDIERDWVVPAQAAGSSMMTGV